MQHMKDTLGHMKNREEPRQIREAPWCHSVFTERQSTLSPSLRLKKKMSGITKWQFKCMQFKGQRIQCEGFHMPKHHTTVIISSTEWLSIVDIHSY